MLKELPANCELTSHAARDARLYEAPPARRRGRMGRPRKRGKRLPSPKQLLSQRRGRRVNLELYGRRDHVRLVDLVAYLHALPQWAVRVVVVPARKLRLQSAGILLDLCDSHRNRRAPLVRAALVDRAGVSRQQDALRF